MGRAQSTVSIHGDVEGPVRVCIDVTCSADVPDRELSDVEDFADVGDECLWRQAIDAASIVDVV
jgi:hypothetical protein